LKEASNLLLRPMKFPFFLRYKSIKIIFNLCTCLNFGVYYKFSKKEDFKVYSKNQNGIESTIAEFKTEKFLFEIFGQNIPTEKQNAYRHMIIENRILNEKGVDFKHKIIELKSEGLKMEPAFAKLLGLEGNPYTELLKLKI